MEYIGEIVYLTLAAFLWGFTNPMLKQGGEGIERVKKSNRVFQFLAELNFLVSTGRFMIPFLMNQAGSIVFFLTLRTADLALAVPITNALTFVFTIISGYVILDEKVSKQTFIGMLMVVTGVFCCVIGSRAFAGRVDGPDHPCPNSGGHS
ncbi:transmembrane protein 234 homolog [Tubulanus polymorphus]|uniref:transmembrane protein 234 homolog n=1 Tax=Tubulanus polymorphus TaxID=672921 RepID=UPI003DA2BB5E